MEYLTYEINDEKVKINSEDLSVIFIVLDLDNISGGDINLENYSKLNSGEKSELDTMIISSLIAIAEDYNTSPENALKELYSKVSEDNISKYIQPNW